MNKEEIEKIKVKTQGIMYITEYKRFWNYFDMLQQENKQLKDNWSKLKEFIGKEWYCYDNDSIEFEVSKDILNEMQELGKGDSNDWA